MLVVVPLPSLSQCVSECSAQKSSSNSGCSRLAWHWGKLPVVLGAQGHVQAAVQASLPDPPFQLQSHRAALLVLLLEQRGSAWPCLLHPFHLPRLQTGDLMSWASLLSIPAEQSLLSCPPAALPWAPLAGSWLHTLLAWDCREGGSPARSRHREFCLPWSSPCLDTPGGVAALELHLLPSWTILCIQTRETTHSNLERCCGISSASATYLSSKLKAECIFYLGLQWLCVPAVCSSQVLPVPAVHGTGLIPVVNHLGNAF